MTIIGKNIELPAIEAQPRSFEIGKIYHVLRNARTEKVVSKVEASISARRKEDLLTLESGEKIIISERRNIMRPEDADGVLWAANSKAPLKWVSHKILDEINSRSEAEHIKQVGELSQSWNEKFNFLEEVVDSSGSVSRRGLRPPQIGAIHAIGAHWTLSPAPATITMPTGTGKTETMLGVLIAFTSGRVLVAVPSRALREQTAKKFLNLGILRELGVIPADISNPIVAVIDKRPTKLEDLKIFDHCNVAISLISTIGQGSATQFLDKIVEKFTYLFLDEAHHVGAASWSEFRSLFEEKPVLQFTATPYRRDGRPVDGKLIYDYPLGKAQEDGYFKNISFEPVFEIDADKGDITIAEAAIKKLDEDIAANLDHLIMARCSSINRAIHIHKIYSRLAPSLKPILIHSESTNTQELYRKIESVGGRRESRIVVCVDMLGEGFDFPQLKIAALHDTHKSLAVLMQFTGRFTRSSGANIGDATVIANIANQDVSQALERLYDEDSDWNQLLNEFSSEAMKEHKELIEFLQNTSRIDTPTDDEAIEVSPKNLRPVFSTVVYKVSEFHPKRFFESIGKGSAVLGPWYNQKDNVLFFITRDEPKVKWSGLKQLKEKAWNLYVLYYNENLGLLFIHSSDKSTVHQDLAQRVSGNDAKIISGDKVFRSLGRISRLMLQVAGLKGLGRRNIRYSMHTGSDIGPALSTAHSTNTTKSNVSGSGFEGGQPTTVGCSHKGRVWTKEAGSLKELTHWCDDIGNKLLDESIDTEKIIENALVPKEIEELPDKTILCLDWPVEILQKNEENIILKSSHGESPISEYSITYNPESSSGKKIAFEITSGSHSGLYTLELGGPVGFQIKHASDERLIVKIGHTEVPFEQWLNDYPPNVLYVDGSELYGCHLIEPKNQENVSFPAQRLTSWDWDGVDITKESMLVSGEERVDSIQFRAAEEFKLSDYDVIFDDDGPGEAADLVCISDEEDHIRLTLAHCKYSQAGEPGTRVKDVVEVCSQAIRSSRWIWRFKKLCQHLIKREGRALSNGRRSRFVVGDVRTIKNLLKASRFKEIKTEIIIIQPGLQKSSLTDDQATVLTAAHSFLLETVNIGLDVIGSQ